MPHCTPLETLLRRDRAVVVAGLCAVAALAWAYTVYLAQGMGHMDMGMGMAMPHMQSWNAMDFLSMFLMWAVMMVAMMVPTAAPMIVLFATVNRRRQEQERPYVPTAVFLSGYLLVWMGFSVLATLVQWAFERSELLDYTMASTDNRFAGLLFVAAGLYQWTSLNELCLTQCQRPFEFVMRHGGYRRDAPRSVMLGLRHGAYCVGCCWTLMALLLVGGVMNVFWIVLLALLAYLERVPSMGRLIARLAGIVLIAAGAWLFSMGMS